MEYTADNLRIRSLDKGKPGVFARLSSEQAGWAYLNLVALRLEKGQTFELTIDEYEYAAVILSGRCHLRTSRGDFLDVGRRRDVFSGMPHAIYLPRRTEFVIEALTDDFEVVSGWVPTDRDNPVRLIQPEDSQIEIVGGGGATYQVNTIIPPGFRSHRLVVQEALIPPGNWAGYPPHKHDEHRSDPGGRLLEADLEALHFYRFNRPGGYAMQRVYTADRRIDATVCAFENDAVIVPEGYHPVVSAYGVTTYCLQFHAGSAQSLASTDDPDYAWVRETWLQRDPRLPLVDHGLEPPRLLE